MADFLLILTSLAQNVILFISLTVVYTLVHVPERAQSYVWGIIFGCAGILAQMTPFEVSPGVIINANTPIVGMAGAVSGMTGGGVALVICVTVRVIRGGAGVPPGIAAMMAAMLIGVVMFAEERQTGKVYTARKLLAFGLLMSVVALILSVLFAPDGITLMQQIALPVFLLFPFAAIIVGLLLQREFSRRENEVALRISDAAIQAANDSIIVTDESGQIILANAATSQTFGYEQSALVGMRLSQLLTGQNRDQMDNTISHFRRLKNWAIETEGTKADGTIFPLQVSVSQVKRNHGYGVVTIARDITEKRTAEQRKLELIRERSRVEVLNGVVREISHDLRTPLTILRTSSHIGRMLADSLQRQLKFFPTPDKQKLSDLHQTSHKIAERMKMLDQTGGWIQEMIEDMLNIVRLDNPNSVFLEMQDINQMVEEAVSRSKAIADEKIITLHFEAGANLPPVEIDSKELSRALHNLIGNAIKYTPDEGKVTLKTGCREKWVLIEVSDTGSGINEDDLPRIFEAFYRADKARSTPGSGLGLTITKKIIDMHRGKIEVESNPEMGSTFRILLPALIS